MEQMRKALEEARFLVDRLTEFERFDFNGVEEAYKEYTGHVSPAVERLRSALTASAPEDLYRHKKRGTTYRLLGIGKMQATNWFKEQWQHADPQSDNPPLRTLDSVDMAEVTIYQSTTDGSLWVRPKDEFEDGRFKKASP